jgi:hypothetical protein
VIGLLKILNLMQKLYAHLLHRPNYSTMPAETIYNKLDYPMAHKRIIPSPTDP